MNINKQTTKKFGKKIKKVIAPVTEELGEFKKLPKEMSKQVVGSTDKPSVVTEAMQQKSHGKDDEKTDEQKKAEGKRNIQRLEEEIETERQKRLQREKQWLEQQQQVVSKPGEAMDSAPVLPTSKPSKGTAFKPGGKSPKSPETRKSKH